MKDNNDILTLDVLKELSPQDFLTFGMHDVAYVREVEVEGEKAFAIHAANGQTLSVVDSHMDAVGVIEQNGFETTSLH